MIGIWLISDLHCEIPVTRLPRLARPANADIAVIAGDIDHADMSMACARKLIPKGVPIVAVAGNHEHYGLKLPVSTNLRMMRADAARDRRSGKQTWFLENDTAEITIRGEAVRFIGATLWTDFGLFGNPVQGQIDALNGLNDFQEIRSDDSTYLGVRPHEMATWHEESRAFIEAELRKPFNGHTIVVTHHAPSVQSVPERYRFDPVTVAFASRCDDLLDLGADLWLHGHTHDSFDYMAAETCVVCNPRGYQRGGTIENPAFDPGLVIAIGEQGR